MKICRQHRKFTLIRYNVLLAASLLTLFLISCNKEFNLSNTEKSITKAESHKYIPEKVDRDLLDKYIDYQLNAEASYLLQKAGKITYSATPKMDKKDFDLMIDNFLTNERNGILLNEYLQNLPKKSVVQSISARPVLVSNEPPIINDLPPSFHGSGSYTANTISTIIFIGSINNSGVISGQDFSFGGIHGTIDQFGTFFQTVVNGVTTYKQYFKETLTSVFGVVYVQNFVVYGNIYGNTVTVNSMRLN